MPVATLATPDWKFGKFPRDQEVDFVLAMPWDTFEARVGPLYRRFVAEIEADDRASGTFDPIYPGATEHPLTLDALFALAAADRLDVATTFLMPELLVACLDGDFERAPRRVIANALERLDRLGDRIEIGGRAVPFEPR